MFEKILIANRGEIAVRILRACRELDIMTVAVHSTADADAMHVRLADESVCIGPPSAADSYLNIPSTGAQAIHPGYGFLSENAAFSRIVAEHGISFIGPTADHITTMGDKIAAKETMRRLGVPVVPGSGGAVEDPTAAMEIARDIGLAVIVKAAAGGGGRGMQVCEDPETLERAIATARSEAKAAFGSDAVYLEKFLGNPRHIEIQIMADSHGNAVHLGERDCSLQRRHQKVLEEAPSPVLDAEARARIGEQCASAIREMGYLGAGTIEFLYEDGGFYFIEMNTRLQVEHPITEAIYGVDLVREQIRVASGLPLSFSQSDLVPNGHAIECRINAENAKTFAPSPGVVQSFHQPGGLGVRVDSALYSGYKIPPYYDSLIGKLIAHGRDRDECIRRMRRALNETIIEGIDTTLPLFHDLLHERDFLEGDYDIKWLEHWISSETQEA